VIWFGRATPRPVAARDFATRSSLVKPTRSAHSRLSSCPDFVPNRHPRRSQVNYVDSLKPTLVGGIFSHSTGPSPPRSESRPSSNALANGSCSSVPVTEECDMQDQENATPTIRTRAPWNKGKLTGAKPPLRPKHVWASK
jgi:hypothetical protein